VSPNLWLALALAVAGPVKPTAAKRLPAAAPAKPVVRPEPTTLAEALLLTLDEVGLDELVDAGPEEGRCPGGRGCPIPLRRAAFPPWLDLAVIRLDPQGRAVEAANVQVDWSTPRGRVVLLDANLAASDVRFRRWTAERADRGPKAAPFTDSDDVAPDRAPAGHDFMAPYPASLFKLLVAFHVERRAAQGAIALSAEVPEGPAPGAEWRTVDEWLELMITESDNRATKALLRFLHVRGEMDLLNSELAGLGLSTLRIDGTLPSDGSRWAPGEIHATAMDMARLIWLVSGGPGVLWRTPSGRAVVRETLPESARARLKRVLSYQARHEILSTGSTCGAVAAGIPAAVPVHFLDVETGDETVGETNYGHDVRPCNSAAEVRFLHKTGLTWNYAADAGLVEPLPGKPFRRYIVAMISSAGTRWVDPERAAASHHPCEEASICASQRLARLGAAIDAWAVRASAEGR
jgi:Beta-lactamase enzyme family